MPAAGLSWGLAVLLADPRAAPVELAWETRAPSGCDAAAFERYVAELLVGVPPDDRGPLHVSVRLEVDGAGSWSIELTLGDLDDQPVRRFESTRCEEVIQAAALVVAMELDPNLLGPPSPDASLTAAPAPSEPAPEETSPRPERNAEPPQNARPSLWLRGYGGAIGMALPGWTGTVGGGSFLRGEAWRVGLGVRHRFATTTQNAFGGGEFQYLTARATGCGIARVSKLEFPLCAAAELGELRAVGNGVDRPNESRRPWVSLRAIPGISVAATRWLALSLEVDLGYVISQERYFLGDLGPLHDVGPFELGLTLGAQFRVFGGSK